MSEQDRYDPGSFGCHEALHMTSFLMQAVDTELVEHNAIASNEDWLALATAAFDKLFQLYMAIGDAHLGDEA